MQNSAEERNVYREGISMSSETENVNDEKLITELEILKQKFYTKSLEWRKCNTIILRG